MAIDERTRHEMYLGLEQKLGTKVADAVMQHLPPVGWADVATKDDVDAQTLLLTRDLDAQTLLLKRDVDAQTLLLQRDLDALEGRFDELEIRFDLKLAAMEERIVGRTQGMINRLMAWLFPTMLTGLGFAFAVAKLT